MGKGRRRNQKMEEEAAEKAEEAGTTTTTKRCFLCWAESSDTCQKCRQVHFCSEEHGKLHR